MTYNNGKQWRLPKTQKPDGITNPDATAAEGKCHFVCAPLGKATDDANRKWGIDRLPGLVSGETAGKYGYSIGKLSEAIQARDGDLAEQWAGVCIRGIFKMDAEATAAGHKPASGIFWEGYAPETDDHPALRFGVLADGNQWQTAKAARPDLTFFNIHEVGLALQQKLATPLVMETKKHFHTANVTRLTPKDPINWAAGGDPIPDL